jgi:hypothetical protein
MTASLHDENNHITIPGFYDKVIELSPEERDQLNAAPFNLDECKKDLDIDDVRGEKGYTTLDAPGPVLPWIATAFGVDIPAKDPKPCCLQKPSLKSACDWFRINRATGMHPTFTNHFQEHRASRCEGGSSSSPWWRARVDANQFH